MASLSPHFARPPVVETVLGVQFAPIKGFRNAHLGAFWKELGGDWAKVADAPLIRPQKEVFGEHLGWPPAGMQLDLVQNLATRLQVTNQDGDRMIQLQNDRLHFNWVGLDGGPYPSYDGVRPGFDDALARFESFLHSNDLGPIRPNQWEATYVNHIPKGELWKGPDDWARLLPGLLTTTSQITNVKLESFSGEWHFEIPSQTGRLHVQLKRAVKPTISSVESLEMLILTLTARGPVTEEMTLDAGLRAAHDAIVQTFYESVSENVRRHWGENGRDC